MSSIRQGNDENNGGVGNQPARTRGGFKNDNGRDIDGGGLMARWEARLRLQRDQRSGLQDRRGRPRPDRDTPDRRLAV
jgi:hypothetical protein